jgi:hypothetical protein
MVKEFKGGAMEEPAREETSRSDIRRLLKVFGVKADEMIITHLIRNPHVGPLKLRITMEDLSEYGENRPNQPLHYVVEGSILSE